MTIDHLHVFVTDVDEAVAWWREHFGFDRRRDFGDVAMVTDGAGFDLALVPADRPASWPDGFHVGSSREHRDEVTGQRQHFEAAGIEVLEVSSEPAHESFRVTAPGGLIVEVYWDA